MTYRDDHEAALARAEALERELAAERAKAREAEEDAQVAEARADALRHEVKALREEARERGEPPHAPARSTSEPAPRTVTLDEPPLREPIGTLGWIGLAGMVVVGCVIILFARRGEPEPAPPPSPQMTDEEHRRIIEEAARRTAEEINREMRAGLLDAGVAPDVVDPLELEAADPR